MIWVPIVILFLYCGFLTWENLALKRQADRLTQAFYGARQDREYWRGAYIAATGHCEANHEGSEP